MKPEKRAYLESVLGKERVEALIGQAGTLQKALVAAGVDWKEFDPVPPEPPKVEPPPVAFKDTEEYKALAALPEKLEKVTKEFADVTAIFDASIKALQEENKVLKEQVAVKANDMLAQLLRPRASASTVTPASKSKDNIVAANDPLAQAKPKLPVAEGLVTGLLGKIKNG